MSILHYQTDGYTAFVSLENSVSAQSLIIHSSKDNLSKMLFFRAGILRQHLKSIEVPASPHATYSKPY